MNGLLHEQVKILPCGNDGVRESSGCGGYRCWACMAIYGSIATPKRCLELGEKARQEKEEKR